MEISCISNFCVSVCGGVCVCVRVCVGHNAAFMNIECLRLQMGVFLIYTGSTAPPSHGATLISNIGFEAFCKIKDSIMASAIKARLILFVPCRVDGRETESKDPQNSQRNRRFDLNLSSEPHISS